jgi:DNA-binding IclR family transcriptional regulator
MAAAGEGPDYSVPALDKALDVLELLAARADGLSQAAIAEEVGRTVGQLFRVLQTLEARGYLYRDGVSGLYFLSMALFELAHRHEPVRGLVEAALGPMRRLSAAVEQSCNLGVENAGSILILAQVESPAGFGFRVRVGAQFPLESTATGAVLLAFSPIAASRVTQDAALAETVGRVRAWGFERRDDSRQPGITDIVFPVFGHGDTAVAALTVPYVATSFSGSAAQVVEDGARAAAAEISELLGHDSVG